MTRPPDRATRLRRPSARSSLSKNSRRHGAANESVSSAWIASRCDASAGRISTDSGIPPLQELDLRLRQANVQGRNVAIALETSGDGDLTGAASAGQGHVAVLHEFRDADDVRAGAQGSHFFTPRETWGE